MELTTAAKPAVALRSLWLGLAQGIDTMASHRIGRSCALAVVEPSLAVASVIAALAVVHSGAFWDWPAEVVRAGALLATTTLLASGVTGAFRTRWRFVGIRDALVIGRAALVAAVVGLLALQVLALVDTAVRLVAADTTLYLLLACGSRLGVRWLHEWGRRAVLNRGSALRRAVIVGAGEAGSLLIKSILASPKLLLEPVAVLDDNPDKHGKQLHGVPIAGPVAELPALAGKHGAEEIIIAIPSATAAQMSRLVDACTAAKLPFRIAPDPEDVLSRKGSSSTLRGVQAGDLLGRPQAEPNVDQLRAEFRAACVVITGAAGTIGSELARQLVRLEPALLYLIDRNENDLYFLYEELERLKAPVQHVEVILDVRDRRRLTRVLREVNPTHVFHAGAFKHVPLMEFHLLEAVENNVLATWGTLEAARAARTGKFVLISTDKAVRPSSVMGATKRLAEVLVAEAMQASGLHGVIVRFGNVLGSNGSVVPLFERQIREGGPVTVTSREATRYFMTTTEAAQLVLQAVSMPESDGKVAILDMGTPVRIWDLGERLIRMNGLRPGADIEMIEVGLRPGEKLHEELWWQSESAVPSSHPKIMLASVAPITGGATGVMAAMRALVASENEAGLRELLEATVGLANGNGRLAVAPARRRWPSAVRPESRPSTGP